jgi:toxin ParE1/3/4
MKSVAFTPAAVADLDAIWDYTAEHWSADQADRYIDGLRDVCLELADGTRTGRVVEVRPGYLKQAVGSHMIYFRFSDDRVQVMRILHQSMDVARRL